MRQFLRGPLILGFLLVLPGCPGGEPAAEGVAALTAPPEEGGAVHIVRLVARGNRYAFEPAEVEIRPGETVRFVHTEYQPESVAFDLHAAAPDAADFLQEQSAAVGPLLTAPGEVYDVSFHDAPEGEYPFFSVPHAEFGMRGRVVVRAPED